MVEKVCEVCGIPMNVRQADINRGWGRFCSKSCKAKEQEARTGVHKRHLKGITMNPSTAIATRTHIDHHGWKWLQSNNRGFISPSIMATSHLFNTIRLIWNLVMPRNMQVGQEVKYSHFGPEYTVKYLNAAIMHIGTELLARPDITVKQRTELDEMASHLAGKRFKIEEENKRLK